MPEIIKDGEGKGYWAGVGSDHRLKVISKSEMLQHVISNENQQAYQCIGITTLSSGTVIPLHIKNITADKNMIVTYIRHQIIDSSGGTDFPNANNYFNVSIGRTYVSDGDEIIPINVFAGSGNKAGVTAYQSNPTLTGTLNEIDRWYTKADGDMSSFNKEGSLIISPNQTIELGYIGDKTSGTIYSRLSFLMEAI